MKKASHNKYFILIGIIIIIILGVYLAKPKHVASDIDFKTNLEENKDEYFDHINSNMVSGGPGKDDIPAIDEPTHITAAEADNILSDESMVFGVARNGIAKAYPQNILYHHEIVNENFGDEAIAVTYCPLTGSVLGFKDKNLGVSGKLYNSNLVLYDRATDSEIPQILTIATNGPLQNERLSQIPVVVTTWKQWKASYPETLVLSEETGYNRDYNRNPYPGYEDLLRVWFPLAEKSDEFASKKWVHGIENNGEFLAVPKDEFIEIGHAEHTLGGETIVIHYDEELGIIRSYKEAVNTENELPSFDLYWFAWYAYHPTTAVLEL